MDKGIVVLLDNDFEGIIPASKLDGNVEDYKVNDKLSLKIEEVNVQNRKIALSIIDDSSKSASDNESSEDTDSQE